MRETNSRHTLVTIAFESCHVNNGSWLLCVMSLSAFSHLLQIAVARWARIGIGFKALGTVIDKSKLWRITASMWSFAAFFLPMYIEVTKTEQIATNLEDDESRAMAFLNSMCNLTQETEVCFRCP